MLEKIGKGETRTVYSLGKNNVLKLPLIDFKGFLMVLFEYLKEKRIKEKDRNFNIQFNEVIGPLLSGIKSNRNEYKNSKLSNHIIGTKMYLFGLLNIQNKSNNIECIYNLKKYKEYSINLKKIMQDVFGNIDSIEEYKLELYHVLENIDNFGIDNNGKLVVIDGGDNLIGKLLKEKGNEIFELLFDKK